MVVEQDRERKVGLPPWRHLRAPDVDGWTADVEPADEGKLILTEIEPLRRLLNAGLTVPAERLDDASLSAVNGTGAAPAGDELVLFLRAGEAARLAAPIAAVEEEQGDPGGSANSLRRCEEGAGRPS